MRREWETLEDWQIRPSVGLEQELEQITSVYQALLEKSAGGFPAGSRRSVCKG